MCTSLDSFHTPIHPNAFFRNMAHESYLIIGGSGFLGRKILEALRARDPLVTVGVFDIVQRHFDDGKGVTFWAGDLGDAARMEQVIREVRETARGRSLGAW